MFDPDALNDAIAESATGPSSVTVGNQSVSERSIDEQIAAARYLAGQSAAKAPQKGLQFVKLVPPGCG